ncbi:DUF1847 domain-containing protein [Porcipelethomonas sp.]|uniref:DUF1847 domain-containing protein n=1 Tax=Porcipelethomonas sp. TaxID=2981675 RepID=UPI003EF41E5E
MLFCANCKIHSCSGNGKTPPGKCPTESGNFDQIKNIYRNEENMKIARVSGYLSTDYTNTRIEETMKFAKGCGYKKIGLAFCIALEKEAAVIDKIFRYNGFETESVICKIGKIEKKELLDIENGNAPIMCNPIGQAEYLNDAGTDLNVVIGLCVGHDTLFFKYSNAPVSVLAVKDRVLAHNPLGGVYMCDNFMKNRFFPPKENE